jgi:prepilin-type N-terminal cleavage/methylation domain-containing protein
MRRRQYTPGVRHGFTLVELLVAMALIIFIMAILSEAFVASTKTFRDLKATGDMAEKLRTTTAILKRYLSADHFEGKKRLSDPAFWVSGPPGEGYFRVYQATPSAGGGASKNVSEGTDPDAGQPSFRVVDAALQFTVKLRGNNRSDYFVASVPATSPLLTTASLGPPDARYQDTTNNYNAQWAELTFFTKLLPDTANGTSLYALYMRQRLAVPDNGGQVTDPSCLSTDYPEVSGVWFAGATPPTGTMVFNTPRDLTMPARRFGADYTNLSGGVYPGFPAYTTLASSVAAGTTAQLGADLLLTDVVSFDVRLLAAGAADFLDVFGLATAFGSGAAGFTGGKSSNPNFSETGGTAAAPLPMVFDTWSSITDSAPYPGQTQTYDYSGWATAGTASSIPIWNAGTGPVIKAIQIIIRVWDFKTEQTRQVTLVVPL